MVLLPLLKASTISCGGVKEETDPRWLEAVAVEGTTFDLVEGWGQLKLPPHRDREDPWERPAPPPLLSAANGRIRGQR